MPLTRTTAHYQSLATAVLAPPVADDMWSWCRRRLRMWNGNRFDPRRAGVFRHWYRVIGARLTGRPDPRDPYAHRCEQLWLAVFAQAAKTTLLGATALYAIANTPRKLGVYFQRLQDAHAYRTGRLQRQLLAMPDLARLLPAGDDARSSALSPTHWTIGTSLVYWRSGNVADDWRSEDFELILGDEFDRYAANVDHTGDPIESGLVRQRTYRKTRLFIGTSTTGLANGHCWRRVVGGSHERPLVDCPHCAGAQWLDWRQVRLAGGVEIKDRTAAEITTQHLGRYACRHCGVLLTSAEITAAIEHTIAIDRLWCPGAWAIDDHHPEGSWTPWADLDAGGRLIAIAPTESTIRSGHAGSLYSLDETVDSIAAKLSTVAHGGQAVRQAFVNNEGAEPFLASITTDTSADLAAAATASGAHAYKHGACPHPARWIAIHVDQQGNHWPEAWFPYVVRAFDPGGASWLIETGKADNHDELARLLQRGFRAGPEGTAARIADLVTMDSANGNVRHDVYLWAAIDPRRRLLLRGDPRLIDGIPWQEVIDTPNMRRRTPKPAGVREWRLHPTHWRNVLWNAMRRVPAPAGQPPTPAWWLPTDPPDFYLASLTSEEQTVERRRITGLGYADVVVWRPRVVADTSDAQTLRTDNHWWDAEASLLALASIAGWSRPPNPTTQQPQRRRIVGRIGA